VQVTPRANGNRAGPYRDGVLAVRVSRPPADGEANRAVIRLLASTLGVPPSAIVLLAGARARRKRFAVHGLGAAEMEARLASLGD
jgi:uncharacterized protein YggU (UPF0235/DUF167 family)